MTKFDDRDDYGDDDGDDDDGDDYFDDDDNVFVDNDDDGDDGDGDHDPPANGQAVFFLTGLIEVLSYISEL